ncbi:MAG: FAD-dependent oxidoreductase [Clostridia bacterium]|nr:FAD-dependent oxidoreductase [Clostridia bacterium]
MSAGKIKSITNPFDDYYVIKITKEEDFQWLPGQYGVFKLDMAIEGDKNQRIFSFASIVEEDEIILGTRTGPSISKFKEIFLNLEPGTRVGIKGPMGNFTLRDGDEPIVMIAGGVGITPIRGLFKALEKGNSRNVDLVYSSLDHYLFLDELESVAEKDSKINVHTVTTPESTQSKIRALTASHGNEALYYISGSPGLIKAIKALLFEEGIMEDRIIFDSFVGY